MFSRNATSAMAAGCVANWQMVEVLLDMGADPHACNCDGVGIMHAASIMGRPESIRQWAVRFPDWDWDMRCLAVGVTCLACAVFWGPGKVPTLEALLDVGADALYRTWTGTHILHNIAASLDGSAEIARFALAIPGVRQLIDEPMVGTTRKWKFQYKAIRLLAWFGSKKSLVQVMSNWPGQRALGSAARSGNNAVLEVLAREGGADPRLKNDRGRTALDQARLLCGTQYFNPLLTLE